jgi:hypothetical protein
MNVTVALLISLFTCGDKPPDFRDFYAKNYYQAPEGSNWAGYKYEIAGDVLTRLANASADYADYRAGIRDKCR